MHIVEYWTAAPDTNVETWRVAGVPEDWQGKMSGSVWLAFRVAFSPQLLWPAAAAAAWVMPLIFPCLFQVGGVG